MKYFSRAAEYAGCFRGEIFLWEAEYVGGDKACGARDTKRINGVYGKVRNL